MNNATTLTSDKQASPPAQPRVTQASRAISKKSGRGGVGTWLFSIIVLIVLYQGWLDRNSLRLTAENGLGYALGIAGGVLMLLLLLYPARKRLAFMRRLGPTKWWFRGHMMLGIIGPVCILFHCNFHLGSLNSNVSLLCMSLVAGSGLIGRYFYSKLHHGLYGQRATFQELREKIVLFKDQSAFALPVDSRLAVSLQALENTALSPDDKIMRNALRIATYNFRTYWVAFNLGRLLKKAYIPDAADPKTRLTKRQLSALKHRLAAYLAMLRKINQLSFYERLFSWWHVLHMPLFILLVISGIVHVIAVHLY